MEGQSCLEIRNEKYFFQIKKLVADWVCPLYKESYCFVYREHKMPCTLEKLVHKRAD
jgi:hypothetical protein